MPMKARTVRLSGRTWDLIAAEANLEGISTNEWVREAVVARVAYALTRRDAEPALQWDRVEALLRELRDE